MFKWARGVIGGTFFALGLALAAGGAELVLLGGSAYYILAGCSLGTCGVLLVAGSQRAAQLFTATYLLTIGWSFWEVGADFWQLVPRLGPFMVMAPLMAWAAKDLNPLYSRACRRVVVFHAICVVAGIAAMFVPHGANYGMSVEPVRLTKSSSQDTDNRGDWLHYGRDAGGTHFAPFRQIDRQSVGRLTIAWTFHTGEFNETPDMEATPLQVGNSLYFCTAHNKVFSLDADTGRMNWRFDPHVKADGTWNRCRGVGYFKPPAAGAVSRSGISSVTSCAEEILVTTVDARLIALDARTGSLCHAFGNDGVVDLKAGLGPMQSGWYYPTSAPLVAGNRIIVGGWVSDNQSTDEPGGVVRAFNAETGALSWAWDPERGTVPAAPAQDQTYARSTPNFWGTATYDDKLGLIYVPTGSGTPDHWGASRSAATNTYSTSVLALRVEDGTLAWHFQTVHHDLWDWDLSAPPTFADFPTSDGARIPAIVQVGKAGQLFVLDRRTGKPLAEVTERPVPQTGASDEPLSQTQPYSTGMPQVIPMRLSERSMWGATFLDQLACRIQFRRLKFEGQYTPPSVVESPITPGYLGGMNWGGVAIDPQRDIVIVNDIRLSTLVKLIPRTQLTEELTATVAHANYELHPQTGAPYAVQLRTFFSPIGLPCDPPPWGMITAINLRTRTVAWQVPAGTLQDKMREMLGIAAPIPIGMPTLSSAIVTASGLVFYDGANDSYLRAYDIGTGRELWKGRLPAGSQSTPMTYVSASSGRQFVVVVAGGAPYSNTRSDSVIAYALANAN